MEAATSVAPAVSASDSKHVQLGKRQTWAVVVGALVVVVAVFLKAAKVPAGVVFLDKSKLTYVSTGGGSLTLAMAIIAVIFLAIAYRRHRKGLLWGTYVFSVFAILWSVINVTSGFTISLVGGGSVHANPSVGPFVALAGGIIMLASALAVRASAKPLTS